MIWGIRLDRSQVVWCRGNGCTYPDAHVEFQLKAAAEVRLVLRAHVDGRWRQVAVANLAAHRGSNRYRLAGRWHGQLVPVRDVRLQVQVSPAGHWQTHSTLSVAVRHAQRH
jgi:hypothetical protein